MFGWILLILSWVFFVQVSDEWKEMNWKMSCKGVEPRIVYKIPEPHMIVETVEKNICVNGQCETKVSRKVQSLKSE